MSSRHGSVVNLLPEREEEYRALDAAVWPEVLRQIRDSNIRNFSIFLRDGVLFSYFEYVGRDLEGDLEAMARDPRTQEWWMLTDPCQRPVDGALPGEHWAAMEEVFHVD